MVKSAFVEMQDGTIYRLTNIYDFTLNMSDGDGLSGELKFSNITALPAGPVQIDNKVDYKEFKELIGV